MRPEIDWDLTRPPEELRALCRKVWGVSPITSAELEEWRKVAKHEKSCVSWLKRVRAQRGQRI